jgi:acyl-CoA thioester hydrolase
MRPKPFVPEIYDGDQRLVRDTMTGTLWHRAFHRTLYADTDRSTWVYHANYLHYFELGRASLMRDFNYSYKEVEEDGFVYPIIDTAVAYHHPLGYDDPMWIHTRPGEMEKVRVTFYYVITHRDTGNIVCKGHTRHCAMRAATGTVTAIDPKTLRIWEAFPK